MRRPETLFLLDALPPSPSLHEVITRLLSSCIFQVSFSINIKTRKCIQCVVIGLQSTGESSIDAALKGAKHKRLAAADDGGDGETRTDYISAPQQTLNRVIEKCFPLPPMPRAIRDQDRQDRQEAKEAAQAERDRQEAKEAARAGAEVKAKGKAQVQHRSTGEWAGGWGKVGGRGGGVYS